MIRRPPISTRTDTLFPYTTLFRSDDSAEAIPYSSAVHINSPLDRSLRNDTATLTATYDPEGFAVDDKGNIKEALAAAAQITAENETLPHKTQLSPGENGKASCRERGCQ